MMTPFRAALLLLLPAFALALPEPTRQDADEPALRIQFLEIVTPDVDETCDALAAMHGVDFSEPVAVFGNARTAALEGGGRLSVRAPMREDEEPVVRPYLLVDDLEAAVATARDAGAEIAIPRMDIPEHGSIAVFIQGGIQHGLWKE